MAGLDVDRIGVGFLNLPPVPLVVKRVRPHDAEYDLYIPPGWGCCQEGVVSRKQWSSKLRSAEMSSF